jgi:hypothetical protein
MYRSALLLLIVISFTSCQKDFFEAESPTIIESDIANELLPYFSSFENEARKHGININYESANVTAEIQLINDGNVAGTCTTNGHDLRHIVIDQSFWNSASNLLREMVVFHELGHCILGRGHTEGSFQNGICRSIMRSGLGSCQDAYNLPNRDYYIEELFTSD